MVLEEDGRENADEGLQKWCVDTVPFALSKHVAEG